MVVRHLPRHLRHAGLHHAAHRRVVVRHTHVRVLGPVGPTAARRPLAALPTSPGTRRGLSGPRRSPPPDQARALGHALAGWSFPSGGCSPASRSSAPSAAARPAAACIPYADQLLGYRADDPLERIGGLVLEVKGDFCHQLRGLMRAARARRRLHRDQPRRAVPLQPAPQRPRSLRAGLRHRLAPQQPLRPERGAVLAAGLHQPREVHHPAPQGRRRLRDVVRRLRMRHQPGPHCREARPGGAAAVGRAAWPSRRPAADIERVPAIRRLPWVLDTATGQDAHRTQPRAGAAARATTRSTCARGDVRGTAAPPFDRRRLRAVRGRQAVVPARLDAHRTEAPDVDHRRASPSSSRSSTTTRPSSTPSVRPRRATTRWPTPTGATASRCRRSPT